MSQINEGEQRRLAAAAALTNARLGSNLPQTLEADTAVVSDADNAQSVQLAEGVNEQSPAFPLVDQTSASQDDVLSSNVEPEIDTLSRADSVSNFQVDQTNASNESGGNTSSMQLSALFKSFKGSTSSSTSTEPNVPESSPVTVEPIDKETELQKLTESLKEPKNTSAASVSNDTAVPKNLPELLLLKTKQKKEQEESIRQFVNSDIETVKRVTENMSITRKHSGDNAAVSNTPRAETKEITPEVVAAARAKLDETMVAIEGNLTLNLANTDISIKQVKEVIKLDKITPDNLDQLPEIIKNGELLKSFGNILRQKE